MLEVGSILDGKYKILNEIGHGGMSVVYLALNEKANKTWAVKEVRKDGGNDKEVVSQGLIAETEMLKKLNHPNLPSIVDVIDTKDTFIIVMDYIEGKSLQDVLNHEGAQPQERVIGWAKQLCDVLGYLHSREPAIIYRDLKPANVMLKPDGKIALIDFGTAREYKLKNDADTTWLGTRGYAAPEQFGGRGQTDGRTDIYNLGATIYHLLTGYSPADTQFVIYPLGQLVPELAGSGIEKIVAKCCEPEPANRYQTCAELMYDLEHVRDQDDRTMKIRKNHWRTFLAGCIVALVGLIGMGVFTVLKARATNQSYDSFVKQAEAQSNLLKAAELYSKAIRIDADNKKAYEKFLTKITENDGEYKITNEEKQLLEQALNDHSDESGVLTCAEYFNENNPEDYAAFELRRGKNYFTYLSTCGGSYDCLNAIKDHDRLTKSQQSMASCLSKIAYIDLHKGDAANNKDKIGIGEKKESKYKSVWKQFKEIGSDINKVDDKTGGPNYSAALYRSIALELNTISQSYIDAGVEKQDMIDMLNTASRYMERFITNDYKELKQQTVDAINGAKAKLSERPGQETSGTATSSESQKGDDK